MRRSLDRAARPWAGTRTIPWLSLALVVAAVATTWVTTPPGAGSAASVAVPGASAPHADRAKDEAVRPPTGPFVDSVAKRQATIWAVGDGADGKSSARKLARQIAAARPNRFLYLGDVYENGSRSDFDQRYGPTYGVLARLTAPTPGNHDWHQRAEGYERYWREVTGKAVPSFYEFSAGGWQILSLNSEVPSEPGSAQLSWLRSRLQPGSSCRLAFWHRPLFSDGKYDGEKGVKTLWDALRGRARIVVNGHDHNMQRYLPRDGITQLIAGAGGHGRYDVQRSDPLLAFANDTDYGALRLRLAPGRARFSFVEAKTGRVLHSGAVRCKRGGGQGGSR